MKTRIYYYDDYLTSATLKPVLEFTGIIRIEEEYENLLPQEPIEGGGFANDSRIRKPFTLTCQFTFVPTGDPRQNGLFTKLLNNKKAEIEMERNSTNLYTIVYENKAYQSVAIENSSNAHTVESRHLVWDVRFKQIIQQSLIYKKAAIVNYKDKSMEPTQDNGSQAAKKATQDDLNNDKVNKTPTGERIIYVK